jgi:hypothetical protein
VRSDGVRRFSVVSGPAWLDVACADWLVTLLPAVLEFGQVEPMHHLPWVGQAAGLDAA